MIDLELVNKMKIPLKNIRVTRMSVQGHNLRCVGVVSQTIQCVVNGKVSGTIHLYAKVVRDLYNAINTDCLASRRTFSRLMGSDPPEEPPDNPSIEVLGGDDDDEEETITNDNAEREDVPGPDVEREDVPGPDVERENVPSYQGDPRGLPSSMYDNDECPEIVKGIPSYCYDRTPYDEETLYPEKWEDCYDSDGNYDPVLTDFVNNDHPPDVYYQGGRLHRMTKRGSRTKTPTKSPSPSAEKHCQYCFLSGQSIKVTRSHNIMDIECPTMTDDERRGIHGDQETDRWLARMHGYNE